MATRALHPAIKAWRTGVGSFVKYMWDTEPILMISIGCFLTLPIGYLLTPKSRFETLQSQVEVIPRQYPYPKRYIEGKTGPPTST